jgi:hypothetical protein
MKKILFLLILITSSLSISQNITGTIKNSAGVAIKNALICQKNNTTIFAKTNATGNFTIPGNTSTVFKVAALKYETITNYTPATTTGNVITMSTDALLLTDVYHISFDHLKNIPQYTKEEAEADFNIFYTSGYYEGLEAVTNRPMVETDRAAVDYNTSRDPGGVSLKVRFPAGKLKTADSGVDTRIDLAGTHNMPTFQSSDLYLSYWVKFSDNFEFDKCGGKLPSLGGSIANSTLKRWKGRIMWRNGGSIQFYMELPDNSYNADNETRFWGVNNTPPGTSDICNLQYSPYFASPGWHNVELHYKFETPGMNDGIFEGWIDGQNNEIINATVFNNYRPAGTTRENITINTLLISAFLGGTDLNDYAPTQDIFAWFDEFRVSTQRINEWGKYNVLSNPSFEEESENLIYPNPSSNGVFNLKTSQSWSVYDILGKKINSGEGTVISLDNQAKGLYLLKLENKTHKIVLE